MMTDNFTSLSVAFVLLAQCTPTIGYNMSNEAVVVFQSNGDKKSLL